MTNPTRNQPESGGVPPADVSPLLCSAARTLIDQWFDDVSDDDAEALASHLDSCISCHAAFESRYALEEPSEMERAGASEPPGRQSLLDRFITDVINAGEADSTIPPAFSIIRGKKRLPGESHRDSQLAPGQRLDAASHRFVIRQRIGVSQFTETYLADLMPDSSRPSSTEPSAAVIKIPRLADEMSPDAAAARLALLRRLLRVHAEELAGLQAVPQVAQVVDHGEYLHWLEDRSVDSSFVAYEYIDGVPLHDYMALHHARRGQFCGVPTATVFAEWARALTTGVLEIHNRSGVHGDICPGNVLVTPTRGPVFVDVGQSLFREVMTSAPSFGVSAYRAPEGGANPASDIYSLGGLFYFLAIGKDPVGLAPTDQETLKQQIALKLHEENPELYQDDAGVPDIIAMCLRREARVQHASRLLRDIDTFWPESARGTIHDELTATTKAVAGLASTRNSVFMSLAADQLKSLRRTLTDMQRGIYDASGSPSDIRSAAYALLATLGPGDEFLTVSLPQFWWPNNIGLNGRFLSMCRNAAARGASVRRVFLIGTDRTEPFLEQVVTAQLKAASDLSVDVRSNFGLRYLAVSDDERRRSVARGKHFGLLVRGEERIAMSPVYDASGALVMLRFRSGVREVEGLRQTFESFWNDARPLVDLQLPTSQTGLHAIDRLR